MKLEDILLLIAAAVIVYGLWRFVSWLDEDDDDDEKYGDFVG